MRKTLLTISLVILVVGIIIAGISAVEITQLGSTSIKGASTTMYAGPNGDYYSRILNVSAGQVVILVSNAHAYLIPSADLNTVNSGNVDSYAIAPTAQQGNISTFSGISGEFYVVAFTSSMPSISYTVIVGGIARLAITGFLLIIGVLLIIIGVIIAVIGAVLKPKVPQLRQF